MRLRAGDVRSNFGPEANDPHPGTSGEHTGRREDEKQLTNDLVTLVREHGRLGYRKMAALLRSTSGWVVNDKRVERIWRQEYGGLKLDQVRRLKELELENSRLRKAVSDLTLDKLILKEAARGNY